MNKLMRIIAILALALFLTTPAIAVNWDGYYTNMLIKGYLGGPKGDTMDNMTANYWKVTMSSASGSFNILTGNLKVGDGTPDVTLNGEDAYVNGTLEVDGVTRFDGTTMTIRGVAYTMPSADGGASSYLQTNGSGTLSWAAGTSGSLDAAYNSGATITVDAGALQLDGSHGTNDTFFVNKTAGTGDAIQITNAGTGYDINGTAGTWYVTKAGVATFSSFAPLTSGLSISGGIINLNASSNFATNINTGSSSGAVTIGGGTGTVAVNSSSWDISTAGAVTGISTIGMSGDLTLSAGDVVLANGKAVKGSTTTAQTVKLQGYDVDNTTYRDVLTITNGDTITAVLGSGNETFSLNSADWDISTTGDMTGIGAVTMNGLLTGTLGATVNGAIIALNESSNFATNIGTGTTTSTVTIGGAGAQSIDIGNGAAAKTVALGSSNTTSTTTILSGSGAVNVNASNNQPTNINSGTSTGTVTVGGTGVMAIDIGAGGTGAKTITIGDGATTGATAIKAGSGGVNINVSNNQPTNIGTGTTTGTVTIGGAGAQAINIGDGAAAKTVTLGSSNTTSTTTLASGSGGLNLNVSINEAVNIGTGTSTGTVTIGGAGAQSIAIGNGAAAKTVTLGSTNTTSTTTINAGSGAINLVGNLATGDAITGDGTAALGGFLKTVTDDTNGKVLNINESGTVQTNAGAGGAAAWTLPAAAAGVNYCFVVMAAQELRVTPAAGDKIVHGSTVMDAEEYYFADAIGESLCIQAVDGTNWVMMSSTGTWAEQTP
jgi:hypothetical protein